MNSNDPCFMELAALRSDTDCNDAFTAITDAEIDVIDRTMISQINGYLRTICSNPECSRAISNYFNACQSLIVSTYKKQ